LQKIARHQDDAALYARAHGEQFVNVYISCNTQNAVANTDGAANRKRQ